MRLERPVASKTKAEVSMVSERGPRNKMYDSYSDVDSQLSNYSRNNITNNRNGENIGHDEADRSAMRQQQTNDTGPTSGENNAGRTSATEKARKSGTDKRRKSYFDKGKRSIVSKERKSGRKSVLGKGNAEQQSEERKGEQSALVKDGENGQDKEQVNLEDVQSEKEEKEGGAEDDDETDDSYM